MKSCSQTLGRSFVPRLWGEVLFSDSGEELRSHAGSGEELRSQVLGMRRYMYIFLLTDLKADNFSFCRLRNNLIGKECADIIKAFLAKANLDSLV